MTWHAGGAAGPSVYGALVPDRADILDLPRGFRYTILARGGNGYGTGFTTYDDGQKFAGDAEGMASFVVEAVQMRWEHAPGGHRRLAGSGRSGQQVAHEMSSAASPHGVGQSGAHGVQRRSCCRTGVVEVPASTDAATVPETAASTTPEVT